MNRWYTIAARLMRVELILIGVFLLAEFAAQAWLRWGADEESFLRFASLAQLGDVSLAENEPLSAHRYLGYYPTPGYRQGNTSHNQGGYRGPSFPRAKPADEFRVVCLGGSATYTTGVDDDAATYPAQLERVLHDAGYGHVRVINAGCEGWSSWESLINLELRVLDLDPDLIVLDGGVDDVPPRLVWPAAAYRGDNSGYRTDAVPEPFEPSFWEYSTALRMLGVQAGLIRPHSWALTSGHLAEERADTARDTEFQRQRAGGGEATGVDGEPTIGTLLSTNAPDFYRRNLENLVAVATRHGVDVMLATVAVGPVPGASPEAAGSEYRRALSETNTVTRQVAEGLGAPLFDMAATFPEAAGGAELTADGARARATLYARFLQQQGLIPDRARSDR